MTATPLPYFFDEAERRSNARQLGEREKALNLTLDDLNWLNTVYKATQQARKTDVKPMHVYRLLLKTEGKPDTPLAGAFAMGRPNDGEVVLYTPCKGLIKFADLNDLTIKLKEWLEQDAGKRELLRFLSVEQRSAFSVDSTPEISMSEISGAVFEDQRLTLEGNRTQNIRSIMDELVKLPTLQSMLDDSLGNALHKTFPALDQRQTRLSSLSLSEVLLHFYLTNEWPTGIPLSFSHPRHRVSSDEDNKAWKSAVKEIAQSLTPHLQSLIETFWNTPMNNGLSRSAFFTECLHDAYHLDLLFKRQGGVFTAQEYLRLLSVSLTSDTTDPLRIERVRITAPFKHYADLAGCLMIGSHDILGYLYTQSRGIEAASNLPAVKEIVLQMLKSEGHDDTLLNFMSLDERRTVLAMEPDERVIIGVPIAGSVFEQLMADILDKQRQNLSHALSRYRESEGTLDPHALFDNALDVRGLIDNRLLAAPAGGRWSPQVDRRWSAQPATVRAETAKEQLKQLSSVEQALEQRLEKFPAIPASTSTFGDAHRLVGSALSTLQSDFTHTLATALRSELHLRTIAHMLGPTEQAMIKAVLDTPVRLQRAALNGFLPDVFSLQLKADDSPDLLMLASCFVLTERGGLDPNHSGKAIAWTPALGFEAFPSLTPLLTELEKRLNDHDARSSLLENLRLDERLPGKTWALAPLQRIDEYFLDHIQRPYLQLDQRSITDALASNLSHKALTDLLNAVALRQPKTGLMRATDIAHSLTTQQKLPAWLAKAPVKDLMLHAELLQQYLNNVTDDQDYLSGVRSLARTAHHELTKQLKADAFDLDPDKVRIKPRRMLAARPQTLTDFALMHHKDLDQLRFDLESLDAVLIPQAMDETYIKGLIRNLNLGQHHRSTLEAAFAESGTQAEERKRRFYAQLPWQLMHYAHSEKLQERLSDTGFDLICQVMDMPDTIARASINGADAIIRPLELRGIRSGQTIKVSGIWLIGKKGSVSGPQVLIAPCSPTHGLKEYDGENLLLSELMTPGALQDWVLNSLPPADRTLYKARMTSMDKASDGIALASNPIRGNLFKQMFQDNAALLARLLGCQSDNDAQGEWDSIKYLLGEELDQATSLFMAKLKYPIAVWRSYLDTKESAEDLQLHKWGAAIRAFISAIAQLATLRESMDSRMPQTSAPGEDIPQVLETAIRWQDIKITAPDRTRLKRYQNTDVDLGSLSLNPTLGLYTDPTTKQHYGPVEGRVYPIAKMGTRWRITDSKTQGPYLRQNSAKQWILDRQTALPRFGMLNRIGTAVSAWAGMNVDAVGMPDIRLLFPVKARLLNEALDLATSYAWNSVRNLQLLKSTSSRVTPVHQLITDFLGGPTVLPVHVQMIEKAIGDIFEALLEPSLRKPKSQRFAVGRVLEQKDHTFGFTVPGDQTRRIYLAEKFFHPNLDHYRNYLSDAAFPISAHARASTLIHELSHIVSNTVDIAYIDPGRPFVDLIETTNLRAAGLKNELADIQSRALSIKTPLSELFAVYDPDANTWEDLGSTTYENTSAIAAHVLKLTGKTNLDDARQSFMKDPLIRLAVQLANADSVTWLITHLGRQLHTSVP
ncbi:dermonecrotic toxin domain-containing protein [Pseudomonas baetica]|uniref:dermonecrotic toxin domain-containing protein n=1 Tax=Pseudomonas baetica TaxID=674054 RepID=UPI003EE8C20F